MELHQPINPAHFTQFLGGVLAPPPDACTEAMPILPRCRKYYDARWQKFRLARREAGGNVCKCCGKPHRLLNVAHLAHGPADRRLFG